MTHLDDRDALLRGIAYGSVFAVPCWILVIAAVYAIL
jgi:hypothetical protein